jgi:serine/threonine-protein phosphatase 2A regulatory subunit B'
MYNCEFLASAGGRAGPGGTAAGSKSILSDTLVLLNVIFLVFYFRQATGGGAVLPLPPRRDDPSEQSMKSILKTMRKKVQTESAKGQWEKDTSKSKSSEEGQGRGSQEAKADKSHILNPERPRSRQSRRVDRSVLTALPTLRDANAAVRSQLLVRKVRLCSVVFTFTETPDSPSEAADKETKRSTLLELVNYLTVFKPAFAEEELEEIFEMLMCNLCRPLPPTTLDMQGIYNPEEDEPQSESTWPHLQVVYEFLLRLATSTETESKLLAKFFNRQFVLHLLALFDSEDPRERDYLKTILHRIYGNFMGLRPFIRRAINHVFYKFIYETDRHNGIAELLEILGSIINGFALPIKEQHKQFLARVLMPLHKVSFISVFHPQLSYCVTQFLEKDASLAPVIVKPILKFWPILSSKKELLFLQEVEEILDRVEAHNLGDAQVPLFKRIATCINSPHFQVSERSIYVLNNDVILRFVTNNRQTLVPILCKALTSNTWLQRHDQEAEAESEPPAWRQGMRWQEQGHWNPTIVELTQDILRLFQEMDQGLTSQCIEGGNTVMERRIGKQTARRAEWARLVEEQKEGQDEEEDEAEQSTAEPIA